MEYTSVVCVCTVYVPSRPVAKREIGIERLDYQRKTRARRGVVGEEPLCDGRALVDEPVRRADRGRS